MQPLTIHVPYSRDELTRREAPYTLEDVEALLPGSIAIRTDSSLSLAELLRSLAIELDMEHKDLLSARDLEWILHAALLERINHFVTACAHEGVGMIPAYRALRYHIREWIPFIHAKFVCVDEQ